VKSKKKELKQLRKELIALEKRYEKSNDEKLTLANVLNIINEELEESLHNEKRFIASVSHELRTPMTSIIGYGELMSDTNLNSQQRRYIQSITQSSHYLLSLVNDLLDVAKFKDKRVELSPKIVELNDILSECAMLMQSKISKDVNFEVNIPVLDYKIKADDKRLKQIVLNLLSNAAKFTTEGSIKFYVDPIVEEANNQLQITMNVEDTGIGIPEEVSETLFNPFQSTDKTQGTGLGLFISQELAELMNGSITVSSVLGGGSLFTLKIFVEKSVKKEVGKGLIGINLLMCSASDMFVESISTELGRMSMQSFEHYDIENRGIAEFVSHVLPKALEYDIIIFDVDILKEDAVHLAKMFSILNPNIKIVSYHDDSNIVCSELFTLTIHKPIGYQRFIRQIERAYTNRVSKKRGKEAYENLKILLVEDVELNRIYEVEMLKNFFGVSCDTAENGAIALAKARENDYDVILMDMRMPVMDGLEATRKIREFNKDIPIICMSANVYKEDKMAAEEAGMNDFIEKPLERSDIESKLVKLINSEFNLKEKNRDVNYKKLAYAFLRKNFDEDMIRQLCKTARESIAQSIQNIEEHSYESAVALLADDFHRLKGVFLNLGLNQLAAESSNLQDDAKKQDFQKIMDLKMPFMEKLNQFLLEDLTD
jgi:CheY-like chemotaxis protein